MGSLTLQYPPMTGGSAEQQLSLLRGYLIQLTDELNGADWSANAVFQEVSQAIDAQSLPAEEQRTQLAGWSSLKELIIKTADYAAKNSQTLQYQLSGSYVAKSDFGLFEEAMLTQYAGADEDDVYWAIREWKGGSGYKKYGAFLDAADAGNGGETKQAAEEYLSHGVDKSTLSSQLTSHFKNRYLEADSEERGRLKALYISAYKAIGGTREKAVENMTNWVKEAKKK